MTRHCRHRGFTLAGMMVGVTLGMIATFAALASLQVMRNAYASIVDSVLIEERGQRALAVLTHAIRQAGWIPGIVALAPAHPTPAPPIEGRDDCAQPRFHTQMQCTRAGVNGSDALMTRVSGSGVADDPTLPDGTMSDCGGYALPGRAIRVGDDPLPYHASANFFYIGTASDGVPQLLCRYPSRQGSRVQSDSHTAGTLVRGVETMQLRYGVDTDDDGKVDRFVPASAWNAQVAAGWHRVRAVQIALVVRGDRPTVSPAATQPLQLFPSDDTEAAGDTFQPTTHLRQRRRVFATTVRLRNPSPCREAIC